MRSYGQYCPIARAAEILTERWTPIIVRNLMIGCTTFSEISAGAPGLSHSLLTQRLRLLERVGVIEVRPKAHGHGVRYQLTEAGRDLSGFLWALHDWARSGWSWATNTPIPPWSCGPGAPSTWHANGSQTIALSFGSTSPTTHRMPNTSGCWSTMAMPRSASIIPGSPKISSLKPMA
jgi:DNA-binding HxlR family transcriptional regulator